MEDVINTLDNVSYYLLQVLDLDVAIKHQKWVWNRNVDALHGAALDLACCVTVFLGWTRAIMD